MLILVGAAGITLAGDLAWDPSRATRDVEADPEIRSAPPASAVAGGPSASATVVDDRSRAPARQSAYSSMLREPDLMALYRTLSASGRYGELEIAGRILAECQQIASASNVYRRVASGLDDRIGLVTITPRQRAAAVELVSRCSDFQGWQTGAFRSELGIVALKESQATDPDADAWRASRPHEVVDDQTLRAALMTQDPLLIPRFQEALVVRWFANAGIPAAPMEIQAAQTGFAHVPCALGAECSDNSLHALVGCLFNAASCGKTLDDQIDASTLPSDAAKVAAYRVGFTDAIVNRSLDLFGL